MKITIFTTNTCSYCQMVKRYLDHKQKKYDVVNIDEQPDRAQEAFQLSGSLTVPITVIEDEDKREVVVGYNLARLAPLVA